jgi:murein DD-endopeptidase MepM/ murein hydrolase activator NlpD
MKTQDEIQQRIDILKDQNERINNRDLKHFNNIIIKELEWVIENDYEITYNNT